MSRQLQEIELLLDQLLGEHRNLLQHIDAQQSAMRACKAELMELATRQQELTRLKITSIEQRRRALGIQIAKAMRMAEEPTITRLAQLFPARSRILLQKRDELRSAIQEIAQRTSLASRVAGTVLGHLNAAVRVIAGAVEQAGVYTKTGSPQLTRRIGVMEAVG